MQSHSILRGLDCGTAIFFCNRAGISAIQMNCDASLFLYYLVTVITVYCIVICYCFIVCYVVCTYCVDVIFWIAVYDPKRITDQ